MRMMMFRPFTTIGTNKQVHKCNKYEYVKVFFTVFWILAVVVSRGVYYLLEGGKMADTYGFFSRAMIRLKEGTPPLDSGVAYAYTKNLSTLLRFAGNRIEAVGFYQMVLQILWLILLFAGISLLFGYAAGVAAGSILACSPWLMGTILTVWPGNYYMLHFSLALVLLGYFGYRAGKKGWVANDFGRLCLAGIGFYVGVLCTWNVLGGLLALAIFFILLKGTLFSKREKRVQEKAEAGQKSVGRGTMGWGTQTIVLTEGILIGIFATLMKYTGVSGEAIAGQVKWWFLQIKNPLAQYSEMQIPFIIRLLCAAFAGILCQILFHIIWERQKAGMGSKSLEDGEESPVMTGNGKGWEREMTLQGEEGKYIVTEDGRRIKLLDNPLPGPKKHVHKEMDFDLDFEREKDDFDILIGEDDDFDV